jgi:hypothetical protein
MPNASYVLLLRRLTGRSEYYLPSEPVHYAAAHRREVARVEHAAGVDNWPWGEAVGGLQVACIPLKGLIDYQPARIVGGPAGGQQVEMRRAGGANVPVLIALRNGSGEALAVSIFPADKFLALRAIGPDEGAVQHDFYRYLPAQAPAFEAKHVLSIGPGEIVFLGPTGPSRQGVVVSMPLGAGQWRVQAAYACQRQGGEGDVPKLWTGKAESRPAALEVRKAPGLGS